MQKRCEEIDLLRFFGILLMVMGHVGFGVNFDKYIHSFHMPLWFFISGYFCNYNKETKNYIKNKVLAIIIPYVFFSVFYLILSSVLFESRWLGIIYPNTIQIPLNGALWFLPALFFTDIVSFLILKYTPPKVSCLILVSLAAIGSLHFIVIPFSIDSSLTGIGFYYLGYLLKKKCPFIFNLNTYLVLIMFTINFVLIFINGEVNMRSNNYSNIILFWVNSVMALIIMFNLFRIINKNGSLSFFKSIGKNSIIYVCTNQFFILIFSKLYSLDATGNYIIILKLFVTVMVILSGYICYKIIIKTPLRIILGVYKK